MTCHCFLRPIRRDLTSSSYTTANFMFYRGSIQATTKFPPLSELLYETEGSPTFDKVSDLEQSRWRLKEREYFQLRFRCRHRPRILRSLIAEKREKLFNIFKKIVIRKTRCEYIWEKSTFWKVRIFLHLLHTKPQQGELSFLNFLLCTLFIPGCQTFRDERHHIFLNFYSKITPLRPSYQSKTITIALRWLP